MALPLFWRHGLWMEGFPSRAAGRHLFEKTCDRPYSPVTDDCTRFMSQAGKPGRGREPEIPFSCCLFDVLRRRSLFSRFAIVLCRTI